MESSSDLNLTALIRSVERDILLLELLETKSDQNPDSSDLPYPFHDVIQNLKDNESILSE